MIGARFEEMPMVRELCKRPGRIAVAIGGLLMAAVSSGTAGADDLPNIPVTIKEHRFTPAEIHVPVGRPVILTIKNEDPTAEEFDSSALKVEKVIAGGNYGTVRLRPL